MAGYLLDTNHLSHLVTAHSALRLRLVERAARGDRFAFALPCLAELIFGLSILPRATQNLSEWAKVAPSLQALNIEYETCVEAGLLQMRLRKRGWQLDTVDAFVAVLALRGGYTVLTTDGDFKGVSGLDHANWLVWPSP